MTRQAQSPANSLKDEVNVLTELQRELQDEVGKYTGDAKKLGSQTVEMDSINDEIASAVEMAKLIGNEIEALKIELNAPDRVRVLKEAKAPLALDSARRVKFTGMAAGGRSAPSSCWSRSGSPAPARSTRRTTSPSGWASTSWARCRRSPGRGAGHSPGPAARGRSSGSTS